ncbi:MAG: metallophosphoesterase [Solirubrobacterales bacterium]|nr:metallophosphoesterase [Solirubrobacterales bacterium]
MTRAWTAALGAALAALAGLAVRALWIEPRRIRVHRRTLRLPHWPAELDGLRVALVGDVHAGSAHVTPQRVARAARALARRRPDLLLLAGDLMDGDQDVPAEPFAHALASTGLPRAAVLGNHDRAYGGGRVARALTAAGFRLLENAAWPVRLRGTDLHVVGVSDDTTGDADPGHAFDGVREGAPVLVLTHSPDAFPRIPARAALTVAGHTHGGQVAVPRLRARVIPSRHGERYAEGHVVEGGRHLFVTTGVGTSRWPIRLGAQAEVVLLRLRSGG